jgi:methionyl aminopeptidase
MSTIPEVLPAANDPCWCGSGRKYKRCHKGTEGRIQPGVVSPMRTVPRVAEARVKTPDVIERMRRTGAAAAEILRRAGEIVRPGITTDEIDIFVHDLTIEMGGYPSPLNYHGYPKSVCTSVNEVICHGIPDSRVLLDGDIINLDVTIFREGVHGDTNASFPVGNISQEDADLIRVTEECTWKGIEAVRPGAPINEIGRAIETHAKKHKLGVVRAFVGHGIGENFHTDIQVMHYYDPRHTMIIRPGMTFTIEPMITLGTWQHRMWDDDWTAVTADGRRTAQFEHMLVVTETGADVLTAGPGAVSPCAPWNR